MIVILFLFASSTAFSVHCSDKLQVIEVDYCVAIDLLVPEHMDIQAACTCLDFHDHRSHSNLSSLCRCAQLSSHIKPRHIGLPL